MSLPKVSPVSCRCTIMSKVNNHPSSCHRGFDRRNEPAATSGQETGKNSLIYCFHQRNIGGILLEVSSYFTHRTHCLQRGCVCLNISPHQLLHSLDGAL